MASGRVSLVLLTVCAMTTSACGADLSAWYPFQAKSTPEAGAIGMQGWLEKPAGKHGRIVRKGGQLVYNGRPIRLWGLNLCFSTCAPEKELADRRAAFYPKYGINSVRLHKFADGHGWAGIQSADSAAEYDPEGLERMDYQVARLKEAGIYVKLSAHFGTIKIGPADKRDVPYAEEFGKFDGRKNRVSAPHSALFYSPDLQKLHIRQMVNLLKHRNPHTGLTYAQDPAIAAIEIINEQSVLFYTSMGPLQKSATLRRMATARFCDWLRAKYGSREGLLKAWGAQALDSFKREMPQAVGEHLDKRNIVPVGNPWFWDPKQLAGSQAFRKQRHLDTLRFLYELQCEAYGRYVKAVRDAGYQGEILASNWQAGRAYSHYYNLHTDYLVGLIDRHNYFGGGRQGSINNASMLRVPGSGMLSAGMQQVADRPFMLSEWIHVFPNEWGAEGPAIIGAYGMGLQGWDVSYLFQNRDGGGFSSRLGEAWDVTVPQVLGVFPAVARQVLRGDVKESDVLAARRVHVPSLAEGRLGFDDQIGQQHDVKTFDSDKVPARTLAVARSVVEFTRAYHDTPAFDLRKYEKDGVLTSTTGQLRWAAGKQKLDGHFTVDSPATKAVVGFAEGKTFALGDVTIQPRCPFAAIYVTAQGQREDLHSAKALLVVAIARARNTGMKISEDGTRLLDKGRGPILMEPVRATITLRRPGSPKVTLLDHDGLPTGRTLQVKDGAFHIDGAKDCTPYYLVQY